MSQRCLSVTIHGTTSSTVTRRRSRDDAGITFVTGRCTITCSAPSQRWIAFSAAGLEVAQVLPSRPHHIVILARRPLKADPVAPQGLRQVLRGSPFLSDRREA